MSRIMPPAMATQRYFGYNSDVAPLGKAVLDNPTPGEVFDYTTPAKKTVQVELVSVRPAD